MIERVLPLFYEQEELKIEVDKAWRKMVTTEYRSIISSLTVLGVCLHITIFVTCF